MKKNVQRGWRELQLAARLFGHQLPDIVIEEILEVRATKGMSLSRWMGWYVGFNCLNCGLRGLVTPRSLLEATTVPSSGFAPYGLAIDQPCRGRK